MPRAHFVVATALATAALVATAQAQTPPPFATTKVDGTENVYVFGYGGHQAMFIVTPQGVIATNPIGLRRPAAKTYIEEIQKITKAPIKYVIYSHSHFDHIAGGQPFKDLGAMFVAHKNAKARIETLKPADVVVLDQVVDAKRTINLSAARRSNCSTSARIAMDWERLIPGHPGPGGRQIGTKDDARAVLAYLQDLSAAVKKATDEGKCYADAERDLKIRELGELRPVPAHERRALLRFP